MHATTLTTLLFALAPVAFAQSSITSTPNMVPIPTPSAPPVTMAWNDAPTSGALVSEASSLNAAMQSAMASVSMEAGMTMSDGSVMPMSGMSGMSGAMATGTAMPGMDMSGSAESTRAGWGMGVGVVVLLGLI